MTEDHDRPSVQLWTGAARVTLVMRVFDAMGDRVRPVAIGGPRGGQVAELADRLGCPYVDDARKLILDYRARYLLVANTEGLSLADFETALDRGIDILALEPIIDGLSPSIFKRTPNTQSGRIIPVPGFAFSPGWEQAVDPWDGLGRIQLIALANVGPGQECSLYTRVADGWRTVVGLAGLPESIDASLTGPLAHAPESLRGLAGHLSAHARLPEGGCALLRCSDQPSYHQSQRVLDVQSENGRLWISDGSYALYGPRGERLEGSAPSTNDPAPPEQPPIDRLIAFQWKRLLAQVNPPPDGPDPVDEAQVIACCLASLLSARTGVPENPHKFLKLHGH